MKKYICLMFYLLAFLIFLGCASTVPPEKLIVQRVISVQGSQTQIYDSSMVWLVKTLGSVEDLLDPLEYRNRETGEVIRNASWTYRSDVWRGPPVYVTLAFSINIQARDNKSRVTIDKISKRPTALQSGKIYEKEVEEIKKQLESIIDGYEAHIIARSLDEW